jgi:hypothetical protein
MFRKIFLLGFCSGIFSAVACIIYNRVYYFALEAKFAKLVNPGGLIGICLLTCILAAFGYWGLKKWIGNKSEIIFNIIFTLLSFASIILPFSISLPLDMQNPELFPGLTVPMHFFPAIGWYTLKPVFLK